MVGLVRGRLGLVVAALVMAVSVVGVQPASSAPADVGYRDFSFAASGVSAPTGQKPQSKLFFNDGAWWGVLFSTSSGAYNIYELDSATQEWSDTGVIVEPRNSAQLDVLFDGTKLYVASGNKSASASQATEVRRFTYLPATRSYSLDANFPADIVGGGMESGVIDKDSTGVLWFTYTRANGVYVTRTDGSDSNWITPYLIPVSGANNLSSEDQSAVVSYDGQIGVLWSNENDEAMYFAYRVDGSPDTAWILNTAVQLPEYADDHLNLKSIQATNDGRVFAATKTSLNNGTAPLILLLELTQNGNWKRHTVWRVSDNVTRPMVLIDEENGKVFVFATGPCCSGGKVFYKEAPLTNINFGHGQGTVFMESSLDTKINNVTSTKQPLNSTTGLVAIASDDTSDYYLHNTLTLGPDTQPPETTLTVVPNDPSGPDGVEFHFESSETSSTFECQLDGAPAAPCISPVSYSGLVTGAHTFSVAATDNASNTDPTPATHAWSVVSVATISFNPTDDASVFEATPTTNEGPAIRVKVDKRVSGNNSVAEGLIRFDVSGLSGSVTTAKLRFFSTNGTSNGPKIFPSATTWDESNVTWSTRPSLTGSAVADLSSVTAYQWQEVDVTSAVSGNGTVSFSMVPDSNDAMDFASSESSDIPQLVVSFQSAPADFVTLNPTDDAQVSQNSANTNYGPSSSLTSDSNARRDSYLKFDASSIGNAVTSAVLRVYVTNGSGNGPELRLSDTAWSEGAVTWNTRPVTTSGVVANLGAIGSGAYVDYNVLSAITGPGLYSFHLSSVSSDGTTFSSKEAGTNPPELIIGSTSGPDTTPPQTSISSGPTSPTNNSTAQFDFLSSEANSTFECRLDASAWTACVSGTDYSGLTIGTHNFSVRATDAANNTDLTPATYTWEVVGGGTIVVVASADSYVRENSANSNYGSVSTLVSDGGTGVGRESLMRFDISGITTTVTEAKLRIWVTNGSWNGPEVFATDTAWVESGVTWNTKPAVTSAALFDAGGVPVGEWYEFDLTGSVTADGSYSFLLNSTSTDGLLFDSKEGANPPELVLTVS